MSCLWKRGVKYVIIRLRIPIMTSKKENGCAGNTVIRIDLEGSTNLQNEAIDHALLQMQ